MRHLITCLLLVLVPVSAAQAHVLSKSHSSWEQTESGFEVEFRLPLEEVANLPAGESPLEYWPAHLELLEGDRSCRATSATRAGTGADGWAVYHWQVDCSGEGPLSIRSELLNGLVPQHVHLARLSSEGDPMREKILVARDPVWNLDTDESDGTSLVGYFILGVEHILGGWDHLAFVMALILLVGSFREVLKLVTGFTLAHSLTLGMAALGMLRPDTAAVEILIGFSIALVAVENFWWLGGRGPAVPRVVTGVLALAGFFALGSAGHLSPMTWFGLALFSYCHFRLLDVTGRGQLLRAVIAFAFGLVHGFGFGGALMEIGLPSDRIVSALLGFNIGVEVGQLMVVVVVFPLLRLVYRGSARAGRLVAETGSVAIFAVGLYWAIARNW